MSMLDYALRYAARGWRVFPCAPKGKAPRTVNGFKSATTHEGVIKDWWERWPDANIGFAIPEGLLVLDFDPRNYGESFMPHQFPYTRTVSTPQGGHHLYYLVPTGDRAYKGTLAPGVDVKAPSKGYVLLPPSKVVEGSYEWRDFGSPVDLPVWVMLAICRPPQAKHLSGYEGDALYFPWEEGTRYGLGALRRACAKVLGAENGERNKVLYMETKDLARLANGGELDVKALAQLRDAALQAGLDYVEIARTMQSAFTSVGGEYRRAPER